MKRVVVGLGNEDRGDDAAGIEVAKRVRTADGRPLSDPLDLVDLLAGSGEVIIVDAMSSGATPGTVHRFELRRDPLPSRAFVSSHLVSLGEAVALAKALGHSLDSVVVYGIEAGNVELGAPLSADVEKAVVAVVDEIDVAAEVY